MRNRKRITGYFSVYEDDYRGYQIIEASIAGVETRAGYYTVGQNNQVITTLAMYSPKACKNVIDTWINSQQIEPFKKLAIEL